MPIVVLPNLTTVNYEEQSDGTYITSSVFNRHGMLIDRTHTFDSYDEMINYYSD